MTLPQSYTHSEITKYQGWVKFGYTEQIIRMYIFKMIQTSLAAKHYRPMLISPLMSQRA